RDFHVTGVQTCALPIFGSFFGDGRDAGSRKHEGIDIFANRSTPAVAAANGIISRVGLNNLGGKIVFLKPEGLAINLYYAHLDSRSEERRVGKECRHLLM